MFFVELKLLLPVGLRYMNWQSHAGEIIDRYEDILKREQQNIWAINILETLRP